ncbi:Acetoin utilization deacetylase AcuC [Lishizhenia tianjinensis]|uniref:Acetoin utilization deacetylase AcuC n=1 Tax=Lishizhenia tianjinensis TaxID=477690 RepID=A0A1I6YEP2_9FLAO|nr:histone deacetylase [Lishizhenia tianjinensis]SFT49006.1 Acetoin utilization deacetylase AcuC [Lishizhenia tianjinensis]
MLKIAFDPIYAHSLPPGHRFPMAKYELLPQQLMYEGTVEEENFFRTDEIALETVLAVHDAAYVKRLRALELTKREQRVTGFPHNEQLIEREFKIMEGTRQCVIYALEYGVAMNIAGGTHHAFSNRGEGFCLLNDQAIAARWAIDQGIAKKILIIDLDVHQGNGTAEIFADTPEIFTFSVHGKHNYPLKKEKSDLDVAVEDGIRDKEYLYLVERHLEELLAKVEPDFLFYQCGVDILKTDKLGRLGVSIEGCKRRDEIVFELAKKNHLPIVCSMGGGYSPQLKNIIEAHANTYRTAQHIYF